MTEYKLPNTPGNPGRGYLLPSETDTKLEKLLKKQGAIIRGLRSDLEKLSEQYTKSYEEYMNSVGEDLRKDITN